MTAPIYKHDYQPAVDLDVNARHAPVASGQRGSAGGLMQSRTQSAATMPSRPPLLPDRAPRPVPVEATGSILPGVVLQLPDLAADSELSSGRVFDISNIFSWVGIGLGALVAVALIWSSPKMEAPAIDDAPTWQQAPGLRQSREAQGNPGSPVIQSESQPMPPSRTEEPLFDEAARGSPQGAGPEFRTARGPDSTNSPMQPRPGEAAPVGRIKNVTVSQ